MWWPAGPRGRELRAAGLLHAWSPDTESSAEVLEHLVTQLTARGPRTAAGPPAGHGGRVPGPGASAPLAGRRIAVQLHGEPQEEFCGALAAAGAEVIEIPVYRWAPPVDPTPLHRLVDLITNRLVDAVTFTSAPAVASLLRAAGPQPRRCSRRCGPTC